MLQALTLREIRGRRTGYGTRRTVSVAFMVISLVLVVAMAITKIRTTPFRHLLRRDLFVSNLFVIPKDRDTRPANTNNNNHNVLGFHQKKQPEPPVVKERDMRVKNMVVHNPKEDARHWSIVYTMAMELKSNSSQIWDFTPDPNRPTIHTFLEPLKNNNNGNHDNDANNIDYKVVAAWRHAWKQAGWNPRILNLQHVQQHPGYVEIETTVRRFGFNDYEMMCYFRHFAMATMEGGGYMVDYDTLPIHFPPEEYGQRVPTNFTSWERHVPSLMGGTQAEWERVAKLLLKEAVRHYKEDPDGNSFSDMYAMLNLVNQKQIVSKWQVGNLRTLRLGDSSSQHTQLDCRALKKNIRAIHVAHSYLHEAGFPLTYRGIVMGDAMQKYHDICQGPDFYDSAARELEGRVPPSIF